MSKISMMTRSYVIGFLLSLLLTLLAFFLTFYQIGSNDQPLDKIVFIAVLLVLASIQLVVQLLFFFHLSHEAKPRLNTVSFLFMLMVVGIIGIGSIWIMYNLDYNMMHGSEVERHIEQEENIAPTSDHGH